MVNLSVEKKYRIKIKLINKEWEKPDTSKASEDDFFEASLTDFHPGSTFDAEIFLSKSQEEALRECLSNGLELVSYMDLLE